MRTADEMQPMQSHPTYEADGSAPEERATDEAASPYKTFFEALEALEDNKTLYGKASFEAEVARRRVAQARELAIAEWQTRRAA